MHRDVHSELTRSSFRLLCTFAWPRAPPAPKPSWDQISYCGEHLLSSSHQIQEWWQRGRSQRWKREVLRNVFQGKATGDCIEAFQTPLKYCSRSLWLDSFHQHPQCSPTSTFYPSHMAIILRKKKKKTLISHARCTQHIRHCQRALCSTSFVAVFTLYSLHLYSKYLHFLLLALGF